jgi:predicted TIM-barrel fold metal-dependent hydrolase
VIVDVNAYLGHWPFRRLRNNSADGLVRLMDDKGIDVAWVSSIDAVHYVNSQAGNESLHEEIAPHRNRLVPFAVINPAYIDWEHDLEVCVKEFGCRGVRLYPNYHNYGLLDPCCRKLVDTATRWGLVVSLPIRQTDKRQQHWLVYVEDVSLDDTAELVKRHPDARFVLLNGAGFTSTPLGQANSGLPRNYFIEISRPEVLVSDQEIPTLIRNLGPDRLLFGTGIPFHYADPALVRLEVLEADQSVKESIAGGNARQLLYRQPPKE